MAPSIGSDRRTRRAVPAWLLVVGALLVLAGSALAVTGGGGPSGPVGKAAYGSTKCPKASKTNGQQEYNREVCELNKKHQKAVTKCGASTSCVQKENAKYDKETKKLNKRWPGIAKCDKASQKAYVKAGKLPASKQEKAYAAIAKARAKCGKKVRPKKK